MTNIDRERSICAQSAGAQAATIFAALIANPNTAPELLSFAHYDAWRTHIFDGTLAMAEVAQTNQTAANNPASTLNPGPGGIGSSSTAPTLTVTPNGRMCQHGLMEYAQGTSKKTGKAWSAWRCTAKECPTIDAVTGRAWQ